MEWPLISVVVITYKRLHLLQRTVESFLSVCSYPNLEMILCDDGSPKQMQEEMRKLPFDKFLLAKKNQRLGANTNKGIKAAEAKYILQLQDDWRCQGPPDFLQAGIEVLSEKPKIGLVRYCSVDRLKYFARYQTATGRTIKIFDQYQRGIEWGRYVYSDRPHLKRKVLHDVLGFYLESVPMTKVETDFCDRFLAQDRFLAAYIEGYEAFEDISDNSTFNPSRKRARLREKLLSNPLTRLPMKLYLAIKHRGEK